MLKRSVSEEFVFYLARGFKPTVEVSEVFCQETCSDFVDLINLPVFLKWGIGLIS